MEVKRFIAVAHSRFRKWGMWWDSTARSLGVVDELPADRASVPGFDCVVTQTELDRVMPLTQDPKYPLRITDGSITAASDMTAARDELDNIKRETSSAKGLRTRYQNEVDELKEARDQLQAEIDELRAARRAAEEAAIEAEVKLEAVHARNTTSEA